MDFEQVRTIIGKANKGLPVPMQGNFSWKRMEDQAKKVAKILPKNAKVLEVGCGAGHNGTMLKLLRPDISLSGIEPNHHKEWKEFNKFGGSFKKGNGLAIPYKKESFDVVVSFGVLEHVRECYAPKKGEKPLKDPDKKFMEEIHRVLRKDGLNILLNLPNKYSWTEKVADLMNLSAHPFRYTKPEIKSLLKRTKFEKITISREFFIPSQITLLHKGLLKFFNLIAAPMRYFDLFLNWLPLSFFSQSFYIVCKKK